MANTPVPYKVSPNGVKLITRATLKKFCPEAAKALKEVEHNNTFWVITEKPTLQSGSEEEGDECWSGTNEVELAVSLAEDWESVSVSVGKDRVVFLCGSEDDECGDFWDNTNKEWSNYMY